MRSTGISISASTAPCLTVVSGWASNALWRGCAGWSISGRRLRSPECSTGHGHDPAAQVVMRPSHISIIGVPLDLGAGRRGVDMGPSAVRVANLNARLSEIGFEVDDLGNVPVAQPESYPEGQPQARYLPQITQTCSDLAKLVEKQMAAGKCPLVLGGDHSLAVGTVSGVSKHLRQRDEKLGMIWIDAHTDMNTPATSPS